MALGPVLERFKADLGTFFLGAGLLCAGIIPLVGGLVSWGDYFRSGPAVHLAMAGFIVLWFALWKIVDIGNRRGVTWLGRGLSWMSQEVSALYMVQWILFGWMGILVANNLLSEWGAALSVLIVGVITVVIVRYTPISRFVALASR